MAQARGGNFDYRLFEKEEICLQLLRNAAEQIALARPSAPDTRTLAAVLLRVLSANGSSLDSADERREKRRSLEDWIDLVSSPEAECSNLLQSLNIQRISRTLIEVFGILAPATASWSTGHPEAPSTELTLRQLVDALLRLGAIRRVPRSGL